MKHFLPIFILCACATLNAFSQSLNDFIGAARTGDPQAQYNAAQCYRYGWGTPPNATLWHHYLRLAAENGVPEALTELANRYDSTLPHLAAHWRGESDNLPYTHHYRSYNEGCYYGEIRGGTRDGYGTFLWDSGVSHTGRWEEGVSYGMGYTRFDDQQLFCNHTGDGSGFGALILTSPEAHFPEAEGSRRYVGYFEEGLPNGFGALYDEEGKLVYFGNFSAGRPTDAYPSRESYSSYHWTHEQLSSGDSWEGEAVDGVRHGFGIYRWADGSWWCGFWQDGVREGAGLYVHHDGAIVTGEWSAGELME